jgi:hypothetical protein
MKPNAQDDDDLLYRLYADPPNTHSGLLILVMLPMHCDWSSSCNTASATINYSSSSSRSNVHAVAYRRKTSCKSASSGNCYDKHTCRAARRHNTYPHSAHLLLPPGWHLPVVVLPVPLRPASSASSPAAWVLTQPAALSACCAVGWPCWTLTRHLERPAGTIRCRPGHTTQGECTRCSGLDHTDYWSVAGLCQTRTLMFSNH